MAYLLLNQWKLTLPYSPDIAGPSQGCFFGGDNPPLFLNDKGDLPLGRANNGDHLWGFVCHSRQGAN
jgi:hypothetical protein